MSEVKSGFRERRLAKQTEKRYRLPLSHYLRRDWQLYLLLILPLFHYLLFHYTPMYGIIMAFQKYSIMLGISDSPFIGLENFAYIFRQQKFLLALRNTFMLNFLNLFFSFPFPILIAILLSELRSVKFRRVTQTIIYLPHFLSWVVVASIIYQLFNYNSGMINELLRQTNISEGISFTTQTGWWLFIYVFSGIWKEAGYGAIVYLAAITAINSELYEAAEVDGAGRLRRIWHVTLPGIRPTIMLLLILSLGGMASASFDKSFLLGNEQIIGVAEVISTLTYKWGLRGGLYAVSTAIGLFQAVIAFIFIVTSNKLSKRFGEQGIW